MEKKQISETKFQIVVPLGWESNEKIRITYDSKLKTVRFNKVGEDNHVYPGPEPEVKFIPQIIEALAHIYIYDENTSLVEAKKESL